MPREDAEFALRYYNTLTTWVDIDRLLKAMDLDRTDLKAAPEKVAAAIRYCKQLVDAFRPTA